MSIAAPATPTTATELSLTRLHLMRAGPARGRVGTR
jgi:hypothetical protein